MIIPFTQYALTCGCTQGLTRYEWIVKGSDCSNLAGSESAVRMNYLFDGKSWYIGYEPATPKEASEFCN